MKKTLQDKRKHLWSLDQFFTNRSVAEKLISKTNSFYDKIKDEVDKVIWIEPSAGNGDFYFLLSNNLEKIAFDIEKPRHIKDNNYEELDFLKLDRVFHNPIFIGNPPFGHKGDIAYEFIKKCISLNAILIAFILPPGINTLSRLKEIRELGYHIVYNEDIPTDSFYLDMGNHNNETALVDSIFQIYIRKDFVEKGYMEAIEIKKLKNDEFVQVHTINGNIIKNKNRDTEEKEFTQDGVGKHWIGKCDFYLPLRVFTSKKELTWYGEFNKDTVSNVGFGIICDNKNMKNKIRLTNIYKPSKNNILLTNKQYILKEINRVKNSERS